MWEHGARSAHAIWQRHGCGREAAINVDGWPDDMPIPDVELRLKRSKSGGMDIKTIPNWSHRSPLASLR
jgi:hypothetical protein